VCVVTPPPPSTLHPPLKLCCPPPIAISLAVLLFLIEFGYPWWFFYLTAMLEIATAVLAIFMPVYSAFLTVFLASGAAYSHLFRQRQTGVLVIPLFMCAFALFLLRESLPQLWVEAVAVAAAGWVTHFAVARWGGSKVPASMRRKRKEH
jgi:hypothetical protein